jgi:hypothetical protein
MIIKLIFILDMYISILDIVMHSTDYSTWITNGHIEVNKYKVELFIFSLLNCCFHSPPLSMYSNFNLDTSFSALKYWCHLWLLSFSYTIIFSLSENPISVPGILTKILKSVHHNFPALFQLPPNSMCVCACVFVLYMCACMHTHAHVCIIVHVHIFMYMCSNDLTNMFLSPECWRLNLGHHAILSMDSTTRTSLAL